MLADARRTLPGVKVRIGRLSDFADAIRAEAPAIPVARADMPDTWIHGPMCDPAGARVARNLRPLLGIAEGLETELAAWGVGLPGAAGPALAAAREQSLLYGEHTWGGSALSRTPRGTSCRGPTTIWGPCIPGWRCSTRRVAAWAFARLTARS